LLQQTFARLEGLEVTAPVIICNEEHRFMVAEQLRQAGVSDADIFLEPVGRNTAPTIALAAIKARVDGHDPLLLVLAADHYIESQEAFRQAVMQAKKLAEQDKLVTFGIVPKHAETGYGYIQRGEELDSGGYQVARFVEKPDLVTAQGYLAGGDYYWNSGMFMFKASVYLKELAEFRPDILDVCEKSLKEAHKDLDFIRVDAATFAQCPEDSIDYAVMEKTQ
jgi:mannose-1-phosphate guanylyltransferase